mmetsp:Transcript_3456/g.9019  ORF Transcript_3456/g.9019 Transcript_3456/m.9019 type:complete len:107 (+) Transcript_3456:1737-2057(+)
MQPRRFHDAPPPPSPPWRRYLFLFLLNQPIFSSRACVQAVAKCRRPSVEFLDALCLTSPPLRTPKPACSARDDEGRPTRLDNTLRRARVRSRYVFRRLKSLCKGAS